MPPINPAKLAPPKYSSELDLVPYGYGEDRGAVEPETLSWYLEMRKKKSYRQLLEQKLENLKRKPPPVSIFNIDLENEPALQNTLTKPTQQIGLNIQLNVQSQQTKQTNPPTILKPNTNKDTRPENTPITKTPETLSVVDPVQHTPLHEQQERYSDKTIEEEKGDIKCNIDRHEEQQHEQQRHSQEQAQERIRDEQMMVRIQKGREQLREHIYAQKDKLVQQEQQRQRQHQRKLNQIPPYDQLPDYFQERPFQMQQQPRQHEQHYITPTQVPEQHNRQTIQQKQPTLLDHLHTLQSFSSQNRQSPNQVQVQSQTHTQAQSQVQRKITQHQNPQILPLPIPQHHPRSPHNLYLQPLVLQAQRHPLSLHQYQPQSQQLYLPQQLQLSQLQTQTTPNVQQEPNIPTSDPTEQKGTKPGHYVSSLR